MRLQNGSVAPGCPGAQVGAITPAGAERHAAGGHAAGGTWLVATTPGSTAASTRASIVVPPPVSDLDADAENLRKSTQYDS